MTMVAKAVAAKRQSSRVVITTMAITSSTAVGPRLNTTLRIRKSVEREPRSMIRARLPVCLLWWKSRDRPSVWAKVSVAALAMVAWETEVKMASRALGAAAASSLSTPKPRARPMKVRLTAPPTPWARGFMLSMASPIITGAHTPASLPANTSTRAAGIRQARPARWSAAPGGRDRPWSSRSRTSPWPARSPPGSRTAARRRHESSLGLPLLFFPALRAPARWTARRRRASSSPPSVRPRSGSPGSVRR
jgi:hypothetical protein